MSAHLRFKISDILPPVSHIRLLGRFEFYRQQSVINIDEMISLLEQKIVWQQPKVTEEVLV